MCCTYGSRACVLCKPNRMTNADLCQVVCDSFVFIWVVSCRQRLFENLRMLPHAPGVQMQAIPEDAVQEDSGDEEEDDPNKRISSKKPFHKVSTFLHMLFTCSASCFLMSDTVVFHV